MNSVDRNSVRIGRHQAARSTVPKPVCVSTDEGSCVWKLNQRRRATSLILLGISWPVISPDLPAGLENSLISLSLSSPQSLSYFTLCGPITCCPIPPSLSLSPSPSVSVTTSLLLHSRSRCGPEPSEPSHLLFSPHSPGFFTLSLHVTTSIFTHLKKNLLHEIPCARCQIPLILQGCIFLRVLFEGFTLDLLSESVNLHELSLCTCDASSLKTDKILQFNYCANLIT